MSANPKRFAAAVIEGFQVAGLYTDAEIYSAGGPSTTTMTKLRKVAAGEEAMSEPRTPTYAKIERAAGWTHGSARGIWRDGALPQLKVVEAVPSVTLTPANMDQVVQQMLDRLMQIEDRLDQVGERLDITWDGPETSLELLAARRTPTGGLTPGQRRRGHLEQVGEESQDPGDTDPS